MKIPAWFQAGMILWLLFGLPAWILGAMWDGRIELHDLLGDAPPYFAYPYEDHSFWANASWTLAAVVVYLPIFLVIALAVSRNRRRKKFNAED